VPAHVTALYARAYSNKNTKTSHLLITNKSTSAQPAFITVNGQQVKGRFLNISIGDADPIARSTAIAPERIRLSE
jgi:hypothetical protein